MSAPVHPLQDAQRSAVDPYECVWLSASAGTGKTQVLSARVLRLLLRPDCDPSEILCLTFTKAGAAEMATRVNGVLARWVRLEDTALENELHSLGAPTDPDTRACARSLFASVLDCPGGGLRIDTIHAFAQYLLANFPEEAQLVPGSRPMEDRERDLLARQVLSDMVVKAQVERRGLIEAVEQFSLRSGPDAVRSWLMRCASFPALWFGPGNWNPPMRDRVCRLMGLKPGCAREDAQSLCEDSSFPVEALRSIQTIARDWGTKTGLKIDYFIEGWLGASPAERLDRIDEFFGAIVTKAGEPNKLLAKRDPSYAQLAETVIASVRNLSEFCTLVEVVDILAPALALGREFAIRWDEAKRQAGLVDFDDQIARAANLLQRRDVSAWIRYKLDRTFDHILIDEAQDTNADQWDVIFALIDDFFDGVAAHEGKTRTVFTVGDTKQAIFGFQGTSPRHFNEARGRVADKMRETAEGLRSIRSNQRARELREYGLAQSFRTASAVLDFVDTAIAAIGAEKFGLDHPPKPHVGQQRPGLVTLWNPVLGQRDEESDEQREEAEDTWLAEHDRVMADNLASQVALWLKDGFPLTKDGGRNATAGDIMVLVRKRRDLAGLIVARLHAKGVDVAGVDRLRLGAPLAVKDLMAAVRFAVQPLDELNLANLLVSPLCGWSQDDLLKHGYRSKGVHLWHHIRDADDARVRDTVELLRDLLRRADYDSPLQFLHHVLVGPMEGRRNLLARLGKEAADPIDELLNAAQSYDATNIASLQGFIRWFDASDNDLKREATERRDQVRVMTVHGAKGLEAPIVILADATGRPGQPDDLCLTEDGGPLSPKREVPIPRLPSSMRVGPLARAFEEAQAREMEEHWRLLYVAMTRAEEALFIGGSLSPREKGKPHEDSWYARLKPLFDEDALADPTWGGRREWGEMSPPVNALKNRQSAGKTPEIPAWLLRPIPAEPKPPRPLAPSAMGEHEIADPPLRPDEAIEAAERGVLMHALLEKLPDAAPSERFERATQWLARHGPQFKEEQREEMVRHTLAIVSNPAFERIFSDAALPEVPFSARVGTQVITGTVDRLLVEPDVVTVVDYKTTRRPPRSVDDIPDGTLRQMAAYKAALETIYSGRRVDVNLLYTQTPQTFTLSDAVLDPFKPTA